MFLQIVLKLSNSDHIYNRFVKEKEKKKTIKYKIRGKCKNSF